MVARTTMVFALEIHGIREKQNQGPQSLSNLIKENLRISTCNRLYLQTLGSQPIMPKISPVTGHRSLVIKNKSRSACVVLPSGMPLMW